LTRASESAGADALLHVTPDYNRPNQEGLFRPFEAGARGTQAPPIPVKPPRPGPGDILTPARLGAAPAPNTAGSNDATRGLPRRASELVAKLPERVVVLSGDDSTAFPLYAVGARGVISVVSNVAPRAMSDMWDAVKAGDWARGRQRHYELRVLNHLLFVEPSP